MSDRPEEVIADLQRNEIVVRRALHNLRLCFCLQLGIISLGAYQYSSTAVYVVRDARNHEQHLCRDNRDNARRRSTCAQANSLLYSPSSARCHRWLCVSTHWRRCAADIHSVEQPAMRAKEREKREREWHEWSERKTKETKED